MKLTQTVAARIAARMRRDGWTDVDTRDVWVVWGTGTHSNSGLASAILQEFDEYGVEAVR